MEHSVPIKDIDLTFGRTWKDILIYLAMTEACVWYNFFLKNVFID